MSRLFFDSSLLEIFLPGGTSEVRVVCAIFLIHYYARGNNKVAV
jgi:hypothetical protein